MSIPLPDGNEQATKVGGLTPCRDYAPRVVRFATGSSTGGTCQVMPPTDVASAGAALLPAPLARESPEQLGDHRGGPCGSMRLDRPVVNSAADVGGDRLRDHFGR